MLKGRAYRGEMVSFGQKVFFMSHKKKRGGDMGARWHIGIWLGKLWRSDEHILAAEGGYIVQVPFGHSPTANPGAART